MLDKRLMLSRGRVRANGLPQVIIDAYGRNNRDFTQHQIDKFNNERKIILEIAPLNDRITDSIINDENTLLEDTPLSLTDDDFQVFNQIKSENLGINLNIEVQLDMTIRTKDGDVDNLRDIINKFEWGSVNRSGEKFITDLVPISQNIQLQGTKAKTDDPFSNLTKVKVVSSNISFSFSGRSTSTNLTNNIYDVLPNIKINRRNFALKILLDQDAEADIELNSYLIIFKKDKVLSDVFTPDSDLTGESNIFESFKRTTAQEQTFTDLWFIPSDYADRDDTNSNTTKLIKYSKPLVQIQADSSTDQFPDSFFHLNHTNQVWNYKHLSQWTLQASADGTIDIEVIAIELFSNGTTINQQTLYTRTNIELIGGASNAVNIEFDWISTTLNWSNVGIVIVVTNGASIITSVTRFTVEQSIGYNVPTSRKKSKKNIKVSSTLNPKTKQKEYLSNLKSKLVKVWKEQDEKRIKKGIKPLNRKFVEEK